MSAGVAAHSGGAGAPRLVLVAVVVGVAAFGAAFAAGQLTQKDSSSGTVHQAAPIEQPSSAPKLPAAPPATALPPLKPAPAPQGGGATPAPPSASPAPAPAPAPGGGGGGGTILEG
jgi:hypothetical protein